MRKKPWDYHAADSETWAHGDYWALVAPAPNNPEKELVTVGFALICPREIIPDILHRHHFLFKKGLSAELQGWTYTDDNELLTSPPLDCDSQLYKGIEFCFRVVDGEIHGSE